MKMAAFLTLAALGLAGPALAEGECVRPTAPAAVDGATASMDQLMAAKTETAAFIAASDTYQACVISGLEAQRKAAKAAKKKIDPAVAKAADAQIVENQRDKEQAGTAFNSAVRAYKAAHPS